MAAAASSTTNMFSEKAISILSGPPISVWTFRSASYMLWLKARSFLALGITTATRNGLAGAVVAGASVAAGAAVAAGASVATGAAVGVAGAAQALNIADRETIRTKDSANFFILILLVMIDLRTNSRSFKELL